MTLSKFKSCQNNFPLNFLMMFSFFPMPEEFGMDLAPNTASSIAVQLNQVRLVNTFVQQHEYFSCGYFCPTRWILSDPPTARSIRQSLRWFLGQHWNQSAWKHKLLTCGKKHKCFCFLNQSFQLCHRLCHQKAIAETCNCYWPSLSLPSFGEFSTSFSTFNKYCCKCK